MTMLSWSWIRCIVRNLVGGAAIFAGLRRLLSTVCVAVLLAAWGATTLMWVRSKFVCDALLWETAMSHALRGVGTDPQKLRGRRVISSNGSIFVGVGHGLHYLGTQPTDLQSTHLWVIGGERLDGFILPRDSRTVWSVTLGGIQATHRARAARAEISVTLPWWLLSLCCAIPSLGWLVRGRQRRTRQCQRAGYCPACGYDLRASKDRCPECGRVIESADMIDREARP